MGAEFTDLFCVLPAKIVPPGVFEIPTTGVMGFIFNLCPILGLSMFDRDLFLHIAMRHLTFWNMAGILLLRMHTAAVVKKKKTILPAQIQTSVTAFLIWAVIAISDLSASVA